MCFIACVKFVQYLIRHVRKDGCVVESFLTFHKKEQRKGGPRNMSGNDQRSMQCYLLSIVYTLNGNKYHSLQIFTACNLTKNLNMA